MHYLGFNLVSDYVNSVDAISEQDALPGIRRTVCVWHTPMVFLCPRRLFAKVEDVCAYRFTLMVLLVTITMIGWATVQTGLIDRQVDSGVEAKIAQLDEQSLDVVERSTLRTMIEDVRKEGEFTRLMTRIQVIVAAPLLVLASILMISSLLYGVVALSGKKPEWHTLLTIGIYASFVEVFGMFIRLALMLKHGTLEVDTSAALLTRLIPPQSDPEGMIVPILSNVLTGIEPFHVWFWLLIAIGLSVTSQLRGWRLWLTCCLMWMTTAGMRIGLAFASSLTAAQAGRGTL